MYFDVLDFKTILFTYLVDCGTVHTSIGTATMATMAAKEKFIIDVVPTTKLNSSSATHLRRSELGIKIFSFGCPYLVNKKMYCIDLCFYFVQFYD